VNPVAFAVSPDGRALLASGSFEAVRLWDALTGTPVGEPLTGHMRDVSSVAFAVLPDGRALLLKPLTGRE
jgi:WD40 repeat protein